jgi:site-specific recombinase XerD
VIPMSGVLAKILQAHRTAAVRAAADDLAFCTLKGTPLSPQNLYNRALAPACDRIKQPRVSWHSLRHTHATLLGEVGESLRTAQAILGRSDLETTLNTYMHAIPDSQRRAVEKVAEVLCPLVPKFDGAIPEGVVN